MTGHSSAAMQAVALESFAAGYQTLPLFAAMASLVDAGLAWRLVREDDTSPARWMTAPAITHELVDV